MRATPAPCLSGIRATIWGDFDPYSLIVRTYAPSYSALQAALPPPPELAYSQGTLQGDHFAVPEDWSQLLYVANFIHEATHYWQYVTRPLSIHIFSMLTLQAHCTLRVIRQIIAATGKPPRIPLLHAVSQHAQGSALREWLAAWGTLETARCGLWGFDTSPAGASFRELFEEFRNRNAGALSHLPSVLFPKLHKGDDSPELTVRLMLENEAFGNEFCFVWTLYGSDVAGAVAQTLYGGAVRLEYGGLFFSPDGPHHLISIATDLAMCATLTDRTDWASGHPCWRFLRICRALRSSTRWKSQAEAIRSYTELLHFVEKAASLQSVDAAFDSLAQDILDRPNKLLPEMRRLFNATIRVRREHPAWFAFPAVWFWNILKALPMPAVAFREERGIMNGFGPLRDTIDIANLLQELWYLTAARDIAFSSRIRCPVCTIVGFGDSPGDQPQEACSGSCTWARWFKTTWGSDSRDFAPLPGPND